MPGLQPGGGALRQGIEPMLRAIVPGVVGLIDVTEHQAGREPFYSAAKR